MDEAKVVMNLKEGIIELQGPVDFVRGYLDAYQSAIKELRSLPKDTALSPQQAKALPRKRRQAPRSKAGETKRTSSSGAIRGYLQEGFFDEPRSVREVKQRVNEMGLTADGFLDRVAIGKRSVRYQRHVQS